MHIHDLPLPLRLRNALVKAGFSDSEGLRDWLNGAGYHQTEDNIIPGVGATGMRQLEEWAASTATPTDEPATKPSAGPEVIRRPAKPPATTVEKPINGRDLDEDASVYRRDDVTTPGRWGQLHDVSMRGGLEAMRDVPISQKWDQKDRGWATVPATDAKINHQWDAKVPEDMFWTPARPVDAELAARVASLKAEAARLGAETRVETSKDTLTLRLEHELQTQIGHMIPIIKGLAHVKELGVEVTRETVARMALIRGLDALQRQHLPQNDAKKADPTSDQAAEAPISAAEPKNGVHPTPEGWTRVAPGDKIPVAQAVIHDYYTQNNWFRYWGKAGDSVIYFYWSPEVQFQDLDVFPGSDKNGKTVAVQDTPWGPGHIIPVNWSNQ